MRSIAKMMFFVAGMLLFYTGLLAQEYKTEKTKDGQISVKSRVSKRTDENGKEVQLIDYVATTTTDASLVSCIAVLKDVSKHKIFLGERESKVVKTTESGDPVVYYFFNPPWPMPNFDCVGVMSYSEDKGKKTATFKIVSDQSLYELQDVRRVSYYNATYAFKELADGKVEVSVSLKMTPVVQAPDFLVRTYFPNGPADIVRGIVKLAQGK